MDLDIALFGNIQNKEVVLFTIKNDKGHKVQITNYGGIVHAWIAPDRNGNLADVLLGCSDLVGYQERHPYFGAIVGRYCNRIAYATFTLGDNIFRLKPNLGAHHLHGGEEGFDRKIWDYTTEISEDSISIILKTMSPHLDEGYPGNLAVTVSYTFTNNGELITEYQAITDKPTPINLTNHCYFNLAGEGNNTILNHHVWIKSTHITETNANLIPTGNIKNIGGTNLDFSQGLTICEHVYDDDLKIANGYDHNFVLEKADITEPIASAIDPGTGRRLQVFTTEPAVQLYTGNWLNGVSGKSGPYAQFSGLCLETQHFPDSPNHHHFPSTILYPGDIYQTKTIYKIDII